jgi:hypothetical protein
VRESALSPFFVFTRAHDTCLVGYVSGTMLYAFLTHTKAGRVRPRQSNAESAIGVERTHLGSPESWIDPMETSRTRSNNFLQAAAGIS